MESPSEMKSILKVREAEKANGTESSAWPFDFHTSVDIRRWSGCKNLRFTLQNADHKESSGSKKVDIKHPLTSFQGC